MLKISWFIMRVSVWMFIIAVGVFSVQPAQAASGYNFLEGFGGQKGSSTLRLGGVETQKTPHNTLGRVKTGTLSKKTAKKKSVTKYQIARRAANANGCKSAKIVFDNQRILRGHRGTADWHNNTIHVASRNSKKVLPSVVVHECAHLKQYRAYKGNINALAKDMNRIHGTRGWQGLERNADCMTRYRRYTHTYYISRNCTGKQKTAAIKTFKEQRVRSRR